MQNCYYPVTKRTNLFKCILKTTLTTNNNASRTTIFTKSSLLDDNNNEATSKESDAFNCDKANVKNTIAKTAFITDSKNSINEFKNSIKENDANNLVKKLIQISNTISLKFFFDHFQLIIKKEIFSMKTNNYVRRNDLENPKQCYCLVA